MIYENDKLNIPKKYLNMSLSELKTEKHLVYTQIKTNSSNKTIKKNECNKQTVIFKF